MSKEASTETTHTVSPSTTSPKDLADAHVERLIEAGLLTEREAQAYVLRDVCSMCREYTADRLGVSASRVDNALRSARQRLDSAHETLAITEEIGGRQEYPDQLNRVDNEHVDGFNPDNYRNVIDCLTDIVDPDVLADPPAHTDYDSDEAFERAEAEYIAAIDAAVWRHIEDKSQRQLYEMVRHSNHTNAEEVAELLAPRWLPMSEKAFAATRDYFSR